jgi:GH3 auxin-responsive promoter
LLRCRELRLISIWHPSFLTLLFDALPSYWVELLSEIAGDRNDSRMSLARRAKELREADPNQPGKLWPNLRVISCWGDGHAEIAVACLKRLFPGISVQRKGLLSTEAVVTIPFAGQQVLAVASHFFEFLDGEGRIHLAHDLQQGEEYEVIVTTGSGLYRYRLQDRVRVTGFLQNVPSLRFLGRTGNVSDRFGEKLSEAFVTCVIQELIANLPSPPRFALLAPDESQSGLRYTLFLEGGGEAHPEIVTRLDTLLRQNPHYALSRDLGQLQPPGLFLISACGYETFAARESSKGKRLGDIKPSSLSIETSWSQRFAGDYHFGKPSAEST